MIAPNGTTWKLLGLGAAAFLGIAATYIKLDDKHSAAIGAVRAGETAALVKISAMENQIVELIRRLDRMDGKLDQLLTRGKR